MNAKTVSEEFSRAAGYILLRSGLESTDFKASKGS
jgi:hypothetical protein